MKIETKYSIGDTVWYEKLDKETCQAYCDWENNKNNVLCK